MIYLMKDLIQISIVLVLSILVIVLMLLLFLTIKEFCKVIIGGRENDES